MEGVGGECEEGQDEAGCLGLQGTKPRLLTAAAVHLAGSCPLNHQPEEHRAPLRLEQLHGGGM